MTTPVIFVHWGDTSYLHLAWAQAEKWGNTVIGLINTTDIVYSMELDRWLVLKNFMRTSGFKRVVYIDSDILLYTDVSKDFLGCDMAFSQLHSGHTMFVNNYQALSDFCDYAVLNHDNTSLIEETRKRIPHGIFADTVGDMVLLENFAHSSDYFIRDTTELVDGAIYDHNINTGSSIDMIKGIPYRYEVRLKSIHFQGGAKDKMKGYMND